MDPEISQRLELLRFPLIVGIVLIHADAAFGGGLRLQSPLLAELLHRGLAEGVARVAVPLFYLMSGYLFFHRIAPFAARYEAKLRSRFWTLLVPFLFWNALTLLLYGVGEKLPATSHLFSSSVRAYVPGFHLAQYVDAMLGLTMDPIAYQFWFVRDLMALVVVAPVLYVLCRSRWLGTMWLLLVASAWVLRLWPVLWPSSEATLFFSLGGWLMLQRVDVLRADRAAGWIGGAFAVTWLAYVLAYGSSGQPYLYCAMISLGVLMAWAATRWCREWTPWLVTPLAALAPASFFVFAAHEPLLTIVAKLLGRTGMSHHLVPMLMAYCVVPMCLIAMLVVAYAVLGRVAPRLLGLITGGGRRPSRLEGAASVGSQVG